MRRFWFAFVVALSAVVIFMLAGSAFANNEDEHAGGGFASVAVLTGQGEVPPTNSTGTALASFLLSQDGNTLFYTLQATGATSQINAAHIHLAVEGKNGPVVVLLCGAGGPACGQEGILATGTITSASLSGPLAGKSLSDLINAMRDGGAYANVHTSNFPDGELRGQLQTVGSDERGRANDDTNNDKEHHDKHHDDDEHGGD